MAAAMLSRNARASRASLRASSAEVPPSIWDHEDAGLRDCGTAGLALLVRDALASVHRMP